MTSDELVEHLNRVWHDAPWHVRFKRSVWRPITDKLTGRSSWPLQTLKSRRQRAKRGWADSDVWNMDAYLSLVIADMLKHLAETTTGVPHEFDPESNDWETWLKDTAELFRSYTIDCKTLDEEQQALLNVKAGLIRLWDKWGSLWD